MYKSRELQALEPLRVERRKKKNKKKKKKKKTRKREARRSTERRRFGDDVSLFVRACDDDDDDDDDDTPPPTTVLSIWRTTTHLLVLFCPRRVEIEREQKKRHEHPRGADDDDDESCRGRRHRHRRRRVLRKGSVASGNASPHRFLGDVVWSVQVNQQSGGESGAGVQRELEDCENRNRSEPNFSGKVRGVWVADVDGV